MARALVQDGVLSLWEGSGKLNGYLFLVPKNATRASMIIHLVKFNRQDTHKPASFSVPTMEDLAFLLQLHHMGLHRLSLRGKE